MGSNLKCQDSCRYPCWLSLNQSTGATLEKRRKVGPVVAEGERNSKA